MLIFFTILSLSWTLVISVDPDIEKTLDSLPWFPKPVTNLNMSWILDIPAYSVVTSEYQFLAVAKLFLSPEDFNALEVKHNGETHCIHYLLKSNGTYDLKGFELSAFGRVFKSSVLIFPNVFPDRWDSFKLLSNGGKIFLYTNHIVMEDKRNGYVTIRQRPNGEITFNILSPIGVKPSEEFLKKAENLLLNNFGFNRKHFVYFDQSSCYKV